MKLPEMLTAQRLEKGAIIGTTLRPILEMCWPGAWATSSAAVQRLSLALTTQCLPGLDGRRAGHAVGNCKVHDLVVNIVVLLVGDADCGGSVQKPFEMMND